MISSISGLGGLSKSPLPQELNIAQGTAGATGGTQSFTECLNVLFSKDEKGLISPFVITTKYGNISSGLVGNTVNFISDDKSVDAVANAMGKPFISAAPSDGNPGFMQKV